MSLFSKFKELFLVGFGSLFLSVFFTFVYVKLPSFYITSLNYSIVPFFENNQNTFDYNGYYQRQTSFTFAKSLALFSSEGDFKTALQKNLEKPILYILGKTNGDSLLNIKLVTLGPLNLEESNIKVEESLKIVLKSISPADFKVSLTPLSYYSYTYKAGFSPTKMFFVFLGLFLILGSLFLLLKRFYYDSSK